MRAPRLVVGWHDVGTTHGAFTQAMINMAMYSGRMLYGTIREVGPYVTQSRNIVVDKFLRTGGDYLLMVDADEEFPPDSLYRTLAAYQMSGADILFGNYALGDFSPSFFKLTDGVQVPQKISNDSLKPCMVYEIDAGATGWLFASRDAFIKIADAFPDDPWKWFNHDLCSTDGTEDAKDHLLNSALELRLGEDISFCQRARSVGLKIVGYTGILIVHNKNQPMLCDFMREYAEEAGLDLEEKHV